MGALSTIRQNIKDLKTFETSVFEVFEKVVRDNEEIVVEYNSEEQLYEKGETREAVKIASYAPYSAVTIERKQVAGQPTNRVTLRDTKDFHNAFYVEFHPDGFAIRSSDWKEPILVHNYGPEIMGLNAENCNDLAQNYFKPALAEAFKNILGK